jgi:hypothetical protein
MFSNDGYGDVLPESYQYTYGCMDAAASSTFNPDATIDDGSCEYIAGCLNPSAGNYNPLADYDDGTCVFSNDGYGDVLPESYQYTLGCMDAGASNFNPNAEYDDGYQCSYIGGCLNPNAVNYVQWADYDDGSCVF